jgi:membrane protease YdiL (CAAX protease family)
VGGSALPRDPDERTDRHGRWGTAILVQAAAFGFAHLHGFPSGWVGALLAGGWGLLLGVLRHTSRGMAALYLAHIAADCTIAVVALALLA